MEPCPCPLQVPWAPLLTKWLTQAHISIVNALNDLGDLIEDGSFEACTPGSASELKLFHDDAWPGCPKWIVDKWGDGSKSFNAADAGLQISNFITPSIDITGVQSGVQALWLGGTKLSQPYGLRQTIDTAIGKIYNVTLWVQGCYNASSETPQKNELLIDIEFTRKGSKNSTVQKLISLANIDSCKYEQYVAAFTSQVSGPTTLYNAEDLWIQKVRCRSPSPLT